MCNHPLGDFTNTIKVCSFGLLICPFFNIPIFFTLGVIITAGPASSFQESSWECLFNGSPAFIGHMNTADI